MNKDEFNQLVVDSGLNPATLKRNGIGWDEWMKDNIISVRVDSRLVTKKREVLASRYECEAAEKTRAAKALRGDAAHNDLREALADISHEIWAHWTKYQFSILAGDHGDCGLEPSALIIPADKVARWTRQMNTPYSELTEKEKESDRHQADKILAVLRGEK